MTYYQKYVLEEFCLIYDIDISLIRVTISQNKLILNDHSSDFFTTKQLRPEKIWWVEWQDQKIPLLFSDADIVSVIETKNGSTQINFDLLGSAFYFLSGWQEFHSSTRDQHGRFPYNKSIQFELGIVNIPVVNYYFDVLKTALELVLDRTIQVREQISASMKVCLSHDIDKINSGWLEGGYSEFKNGRILSALSLLAGKIIGNDPWDNILDILSLEEKLDVNSTFFFLSQKGDGNADYQIDQVAESFKKIVRNGSEVAIHGSLGSAESSQKLKKDVKLLKIPIKGNRFHYLKYDPATVGDTLENSGLAYDGSFGFAEQIGFRHGYCFPFHPFDHNQKKSYSFIEIPLTIMDTTLAHPSYMGNDENTDQIIALVIDEIAKFNGVISILWHNNYFSEYKYAGWRDRYIHLISSLKSKNATFYTHESLANMYNA